MSKSSKVILFMNSLDTYYRHRQPLARHLQSKGHDVILLMPLAKQESQKIADFTVIQLPLSRRGINPLREVMTICMVAWTLLRIRPQYLHNFTIKPVLYGTLCAILTPKVKVLNSITGLGKVFNSDYSHRSVKKIVNLLYKWALKRRRTLFIFQNPEDLKTICNIWQPEQCHLVPGSGVDTDIFSFRPHFQQRLKTICVSRIMLEKGVDMYLACLRASQSQIAGISGSLIGEVEETEKTAIANLLANLPESVHYLGKRDDIASLLHQHGIFFYLPKHREGFPKAVLEAMSCGNMVLVSDVPGCRDLVQDGRNGFVVKPTLSAVQEKLHFMSQLDENDFERITTTARQDVEEKYAVERIVSEIYKLYQHVR